MKSRPILFSGPMVRALLDGTKTQTRRIVKPQPVPIPDDVPQMKRYDNGWWWAWSAAKSMIGVLGMRLLGPYGKPGDLLWVRESWIHGCDFFGPEKTLYQADHTDCRGPQSCEDGFHKWKSPIDMPRWASRLTLEIADVRVERLQEISEEDARAEGIAAPLYYPAKPQFCALWQSINGPGSWDANPWVWVLAFTVHQQNVDQLLKARAA